MDDPFNLERFVTAQDAGGAPGTYQRALDELRAGFKSSHWMWFVFPQIAGLVLTRYFDGIADHTTDALL